MTTTARALALMVTAAASTVLVTPAASATPSCVAQSVQSEHAAAGSAWGHDQIAFLATHPDVLGGYGFDSFGDLAAYAAAQDPTNCPADL